MRVGDPSALERQTGLDERRIRDIARENLRIRAYVDQRFGIITQVGDAEVRQYYEGHPQEFTRNGEVLPFAEAESLARRRAAAARRQATVDQWLADLRARADSRA